MEQNGQPTRYRNYSLALGLLATSGEQMQAPLSKSRVSAVWAKDMVRIAR
jgi:hypothetical protein